MSLLDFLKPKSKSIQEKVNVCLDRADGDISKTYVVAELFKVPHQDRNDEWYDDFYRNVETASFACESPQVLKGPDGFPYFILKTPEVDKPFESFCICNIKDDFLLERGWGVVFNPKADDTADWVFTYGNIVNLHLTNRFSSIIEDADIGNIEFSKTVGVLKKEERVMVAQPSEDYLPAVTRAALRKFLKSKGIKTPKVMLLTSQTGGRITRKLVFNIPPENYPVTSQLDYLMQQVGWFLPNDYIIVPLPKNSALAKGFNDL